MEKQCFVDTHVLVWLYNRDLDYFSAKAKQQLDQSKLWVSPICLLELDYLYEIKRIKKKGWPIYQDLQREVDLEIAEDPYLRIVEVASQISQTRDPFDRLLVAHAKLRGLPIVSKDRFLKVIYSACMW